MYKTIEDIRKDTGMNISDFAQAIGLSKRTYLYRKTGEQPMWLLDEVIAAAEMNGGQIIIESNGKTYRIAIKETDICE